MEEIEITRAEYEKLLRKSAYLDLVFAVLSHGGIMSDDMLRTLRDLVANDDNRR